MATDSTQTGYLRPTDLPIHDDTLEDYFQGVIVGITGVPGPLVRPRWQQDSPNRPSGDTDWIAFGLNILEPQWNSYLAYKKDIDSYVEQGVEVVEVNTSFYGPNHTLNRRNWQAGIQIEQNLWDLQQHNIRFTQFLHPVNVPVLLKQQWAMRSDVKGIFQRAVSRTYPIKTFLSASGSIDNERYATPITVVNPNP